MRRLTPQAFRNKIRFTWHAQVSREEWGELETYFTITKAWAIKLAWWDEIRYRPWCTFTKLNTNLFVALIRLILPRCPPRSNVLTNDASRTIGNGNAIRLFRRMDRMELRRVQRWWWMNEWIKRTFTVPFVPSVSVKWLKGRILFESQLFAIHPFPSTFRRFAGFTVSATCGVDSWTTKNLKYWAIVLKS